MEQKLKYCKVVDPDEEPPYYSLHFYKKRKKKPLIRVHRSWVNIAHFNYYGDGGPKIGPIIVSIQDQGVGEEKNRAHSRVLVRTKKVARCLRVKYQHIFRDKFATLLSSPDARRCSRKWNKSIQKFSDRQNSSSVRSLGLRISCNMYYCSLLVTC